MHALWPIRHRVRLQVGFLCFLSGKWLELGIVRDKPSGCLVYTSIETTVYAYLWLRALYVIKWHAYVARVISDMHFFCVCVSGFCFLSSFTTNQAEMTVIN